MRISILIFIYTIHFAYLKNYTKFHTSNSSSHLENSDKNVHMSYIGVTEEKIENLKNEGKIRISILIFIYTIYFAYLKNYTKFHTSNSSSHLENSDKNVHMSYIGVTEEKIENLKNEGKIRISILIFIYTIYFAYLEVYTKN